MIKVKDGYGKLIGTTYQGSSTLVLLSNGGNLEFSAATKANTLVQRNANLYIYATYFNSSISDEGLTDIGSVYVRNTSDTFIRRISKNQFYSIIGNKFVTLDTAQTITGTKTFRNNFFLNGSASLILNLDASNHYTTAIKWYKGGTSKGTYDPSIGLHNIGGDGKGSICVLPYPTSAAPWEGTVGLFISKGILKLDGLNVIHSGNYHSYFGYIGTTKVQKTSAAQALTGISSINGRLTISAENDLTRLGFGNAHHIVFGEPGYVHRYYYFRPAYSAAGATLTEVYIQNASAATSPTWITTHTFAANGDARHIGAVIVGSNKYWFENTYGLNLSNSDIVGVNGIYFADLVDSKGEGINFYRNASTWDTLTAANGLLYFSPNRATNTHTLTPLFSSLANSGNKISITVGGLNRTLTVAYASNAETLGGERETTFYRKRGSYGTIANSIPTASELATNNGLNGSWLVKYTGASGHLIQFNADGSTRYVLFYSKYDGSLLWRNSTDATLSSKPWKTIVDSTNYTGIVLKIGTATRGSAGLPIYLNAGTPTVCSTTLGVSITGNAASATTALYLASNSRMDYGWNGLNYFNISGTAGTAAKVNNTPTTAWWHILRFNHANSTGYYTDLAIPFHNNSLYYKRVNNGALVNGKWVRILDELNYTAYVNPANFVTSLGTNGNYVTWTKNSTTNNLTVPYATKANRLTLVNCYNGTTNNDLWSTIKTANSTYIGTAMIYEVYNDGGPTTYGEVLDIVSMHDNHWQPLLWFDSGKTGSIRHRNKDYNNATWGSWYTLLDTNNYPGLLDGRYVTLTTAQTVSGVKTFSTLLKFTVATGTSPFTVTSNTMVANLNSDLLDGKHLGNTVGKIPYIVDFPSYTSFGSSTNVIDYAKNILKWVWTNQNHGERTLLIGVGHPNSVGNLLILLYGTAGVDSAGYPRHSSAIYYPLNNRPIYFGTHDYKFYNHSLAFYEDIKDPANYYWANIKVSASSSTSTSPTFSTAYTSNWFRSTGSTGWYNETHAGGIYMSDTNYVRVFNGKKFYVANTTSNAILTEGGILCNSLYVNKSAKTNAGGISLYSNNDPMTYGIAFRVTGGLGGHGAVTGDWATYFTMNNDVNRGWIFRRNTTNVASISGSGTAYFNGSLFPGLDVILENEGYIRGKDTSGNLRNLIRVDSNNWNIFGNTDLSTNIQGKHLTFSISGLANLVLIESTGMSCSKTVTASGFVKLGSSNNYVLLGGGGHKLLSDIFSSYNLYASNVSNYSSNMAVYYTVIGVGKFITIYGHINGTGTSSTEDKLLAYNVNIYNPAGNGRAGATISKGGGSTLRYVTIYAYNGQLRVKWNAMDTTMNYTYFSFSYFNT